jgi:glycosyltransferase involved in cell wall biosynthesis
MYYKDNLFFSIIIPCYNQAHFLTDCLESLLQQTYSNWEAIVVNDGSFDDTSKVALSYSIIDSRIKLVEKENGGLSSARNKGITEANGERLIFLDSDDFLYEECLENIASIIQTVNENCLIQCGYSYIAEDKQKILSDVKIYKKVSLYPEILKGNLGPCHSICISKKLVEYIGFFDESLKSVEDWDFWIRAVKAGCDIKIISEPMVYYRYSKNSMSRNPFVMYDSLKTVIERGPKKDKRILIDSSLNKDYEFDTNEVLLNVLIRSIGVGVMQNKIEESLAFFRNETTKALSQIQPKEFEIMCSYLSFRYWYSKSDIEEVFTKYYHYFDVFFDNAGYSRSFKRRALYFVFKRHLFCKNVYDYGKYLGSILNFMTRNYFEIITIK